MHESKHNQHQQVAVDGEHVHHEDVAYWRRAHRDWRFWLGLFLMVVAITVFFMSVDLSLVPSSQPQPSQSSALEK
jgi:hypothetical protein